MFRQRSTVASCTQRNLKPEPFGALLGMIATIMQHDLGMMTEDDQQVRRLTSSPHTFGPLVRHAA
eukprot:5913161-Amphidinium_carterae.1